MKLLDRVAYNYDSFVPEKFNRLLNWSESPPLGTAAPDFPLLETDGREIRLSTIWRENDYTVVEFGSFT